MTVTPAAISDYPDSAFFDEAVEGAGNLRPGYSELLGELDGGGILAIQGEVQEDLAEEAIEFGPSGMRSPFVVDPVPRVLRTGEWALLEAALRQRVRALQAFLVDIYAERAILRDGVIRSSILEGAPHYEPVVAEFGSPVVADVAGPDLVRDTDGFRVLEDNLRFPSGLTFALAARKAVAPNWPAHPPIVSPGPAFSMVGELLRSRDPAGTGDPSVALLSDGPGSPTWFEQRSLAGLLEIDLVTVDQLELAGGRLVARREAEPSPIDVLYNRTETDRLTDGGDGLTSLGEILIEPLRAGRLACVNSFGAGIADDKAVHCYTEDMIRFYLDEDPLLPTPLSLDLGDPDQASDALEQLDRLVIKPRWALGGQEIVIGTKASGGELDDLRRRIRAAPDRFVAQELVGLSTHPTLVDGHLRPRHVDLRPFVVTTEGEPRVAPLALTRFAREEGNLVVSSTQGGGAKDTWILAD